MVVDPRGGWTPGDKQTNRSSSDLQQMPTHAFLEKKMKRVGGE